MAINPTSEIHPSAIVESGADIGAGCKIGAFCVVGSEVRLADRVTLMSHVAVAGRTEVGADTIVWPFASLGQVPQDLKYKGEPTELSIGANNRIREYTTMSTGTVGGGGMTRVGDGNLFMMSTHVAHDCIIGSNVIMANNATLAGHCVVEDFVVMGGLSAVHQHVRLGRGAMIGGLAGVVADVIPYGSVAGERAHLMGLNLVGLKRRATERAQIHELRNAYSEMFAKEGTLQTRVATVAEKYSGNPLIEEIVAFMSSETSRSFTVPPE
ncbi:MAG: acyl-ACP--UDP-N-acetylglucosamine O-acyltransferase [Pseudomonadota bacterium]